MLYRTHFMNKTTLFADVLLPLPVPGSFTYRVPGEMSGQILAGKRVVVQFGRKKIYTALVLNIHDKPPFGYQPKNILDILDKDPIVNHHQIVFWEWISAYYLAFPGEVMNAAMPSALKLASESKILLNPEIKIDISLLNEKEQLIVEALSYRKTLTIKEVSDLVDLKKVFPLIKNLVEKSVITVEEELKNRYKPKIETYVKLTPEFEDEQKLREVFEQLSKKAFKQLQLLLSYINLSRNTENTHSEVKRSELIKSINASYTQLNELVRKGVIETYEKIDSRLDSISATSGVDEIKLNTHQEEALKNIRYQFREKDVVLLHGITSSGKTEIYIKLIEQTIKEGKQVLYLLPEIALTTQIINRLRKFFGSSIGIYHSRYNDNERVEVWDRVLFIGRKDHFPIILGARSAIFLPYSNLGLIIIDEEYDTSYKQQDPAPRYNARDCAIYLASLHNAKTILGTATPSFESYHNARQGKYGLVEITQRYGDILMPKIEIVDMKPESRKKKIKSHFSPALLEAIEKTLNNHKQVILFQNRRGFSLRLECSNCNYIPMCVNCDISLTYHKSQNQLRCHYCGYYTTIPAKCPECGSTQIFMRGFGTEKLEEELSLMFPETNIKRMDLDTMRTRHAHQQIINDFEQRKIDVLVGTQMITKGLDFDHVSLVGIMNADNMINFPDFRSFERSYQLMTQVGGRSGRKNKRGLVFIQTYNPKHDVLKYVLDNDYTGFYSFQMADRLKFKYPPYYRLILLKLKSRDYDLLNKGARELAKELRNNLEKRVLGPEYPLVSRIKNWYIKHILIKIEKDVSLSFIKNQVIKSIEVFNHKTDFKSVQVQIDVDPM